ncbi:MAG: hypothetical protein NTX82_04580 [Candidatus Parcubacteria bacterium]|nr:hypothetical protein [Candidatus Parcubacteria bacterium]
MDEREIQVSGLELFTGKQWREAILHFLQGMLAGTDSVTYRPKIAFFDGSGYDLTFGLLGKETPVYYAEGKTLNPRLDPKDWSLHHAQLIVGNKQSEAEWGLARFVNDDQVKLLVIRLGSYRRLTLWKKDDGELGIAIDYRDSNP